MLETIDIKQFDMHNERNVKSIYWYIELADKYFLYAVKYSCEVPVSNITDDHSMGWEESHQNVRFKISRDRIVSVELRYIFKRNIWGIDIEFDGYPEAVKLYFQVGKEAKLVYDKIDKYIFGE